ncbi:MFS transporter [Pseudomonas oryzihabitans]|uniref:MFS transporter n=1 Tax=Pseudomonas oryzihabitans TaxID=47885 RepID=UPI00241EC8D0|nr:MFS transporter [Pseudomonas oryzihabitans]
MTTSSFSVASGSFRLVVAIVIFAAIAPAMLMTAPAIATELATRWQLGNAQIGWLFFVELGAMSLATLPAYAWQSRCSWRHVALLAVLVAILGNLGSAWAQQYSTLVAFRFVTALANGTLMILCIASAAATPNPSRIYGLWVLGQLVFGAVGLAILPTLFTHYGLAGSYVVLALLTLVAAPLTSAFAAGRGPNGGNRDRHLPSRAQLAGLLAVLAFYLAISGIWTFIASLAQAAGIDPGLSTPVLAAATIAGIAGAALATLLGQRAPRLLALFCGYLLLAAGILLLVGVPSYWRFAMAALLFKFTWTFVLPFVLAVLADLDRGGALMNHTNLVIGGGLALGPLVAGQVFDQQGSTALLTAALVAAGLSLGLILSIARTSSKEA